MTDEPLTLRDVAVAIIYGARRHTQPTRGFDCRRERYFSVLIFEQAPDYYLRLANELINSPPWGALGDYGNNQPRSRGLTPEIAAAIEEAAG